MWRRLETILKAIRGALLSLTVLIALLLASCSGGDSRAQAPVDPTATAEPARATVEPLVMPELPTLAPPLVPLQIPNSPVDYPADWPGVLRLPDDFVPVDLASGSLPGVDDPEWSAALRYTGPPLDAADALTVHFERQGWSVVSRDFGGTGVLLTVEDEAAGSGMIIVDADTETDSAAVILALVRLAS